MHCPKCGQKQMSDETSFCSRCGFLLTGIAKIVANGGVVPAPPSSVTGNEGSAKRRGVKRGAFLFLLTFLVVPILTMISVALNIKPFLAITGLFLFGGGGLLRVIYALMFESGVPNPNGPAPHALPSGTESHTALPASRSVPASVYGAGSWRDTNDLQHEPGSVIDNTTKLLQKEEKDQ